MRLRPYAMIGMSVLLAGCASVSKDAGFATVSQTVRQKLDKSIVWNRGGPEDQAVQSQIDQWRDSPLNQDRAVQIALLCNPGLQAEYENLQISQADLVQAGLLRNPVLGASAQFPSAGGTVLEFSLVQEFLNLLMLPTRKHQARLAFEATQSRVTAQVLQLAQDVRGAYIDAVTASGLAETRAVMARTAELSADLAERFHRAGNITDREWNERRAEAALAQAERLSAETAAQGARETLGRMMGLSQDRPWTLPAGLPAPEIPTGGAPAIDTMHLETLALSQRLDLLAARQDAEALAHALKTDRKWRLADSVEAGGVYKREADGVKEAGPSLSVGLPVFDRRQAGIARAEAAFRQSQQRIAALEAGIRGQIRTAAAQMDNAARQAALYADTLAPLRARIVETAQSQQNFMLIGVFEVLRLKQAEADAEIGRLQALQSYWQARSDLVAALGASLPASPTTGNP